MIWLNFLTLGMRKNRCKVSDLPRSNSPLVIVPGTELGFLALIDRAFTWMIIVFEPWEFIRAFLFDKE